MTTGSSKIMVIEKEKHKELNAKIKRDKVFNIIDAHNGEN